MTLRVKPGHPRVGTFGPGLTLRVKPGHPRVETYGPGLTLRQPGAVLGDAPVCGHPYHRACALAVAKRPSDHWYPMPLIPCQLPDGRVLLDSGSPWEARMGYSRAFRAGDMVHVAGCVGIRDDGTYSPDLGEQTTRCLERIELALAPFGVDLSHVVRLRLFVTCHRWQEIAAVVGPRFAAARPANAMVEVARLIDPQAMIEIEADAWIPPAVSART